MCRLRSSYPVWHRLEQGRSLLAAEKRIRASWRRSPVPPIHRRASVSLLAGGQSTPRASTSFRYRDAMRSRMRLPPASSCAAVSLPCSVCRLWEPLRSELDRPMSARAVHHAWLSDGHPRGPHRLKQHDVCGESVESRRWGHARPCESHSTTAAGTSRGGLGASPGLICVHLADTRFGSVDDPINVRHRPRRYLGGQHSSADGPSSAATITERRCRRRPSFALSRKATSTAICSSVDVF